MSVAFLVPVLKRPHRVKPLLDAVHNNTPDALVYMICDSSDRDEIEAVREDGRARLVIYDGNYAAKIREGVRVSSQPLIFTGADDLEPQKGWLDAAQRKLTDAEVVGVNDLCNPRTMAGNHATHFLMTRDYAKRPTIDGKPGPLCTAYAHQCCDDELILTAKARNTYAFAQDSHVLHLHPMNDTAPMDEVYVKGMASLKRDRALFRRRVKRWFR